MAASTTSIHGPGGDNGPPSDEAGAAQKASLPAPPDIQVQILQELKALVQLQQHQATSKAPIMTEFIWNTLLQILALIAAALFGAFSILAWQIGDAANGLASRANNLGSNSNCLGAAANWLSLASYCQNTQNSSLCDRYEEEYSTYIDALYEVNLDQVSSCVIPGGVSDSDQAQVSTRVGIAVGVVLAVLLGAVIVYLPFGTYKTKLHRSKQSANALKS